jgi:hypothetical protein
MEGGRRMRKYMSGELKAVFLIAAIAVGRNNYAQDVASYRQKYEDALVTISTDYQQRIEDIMKEYSSSLNALKDRMQTAGDLNKVTAVLEEISRFQTAQTFLVAEDTLIPEIAAILKECQPQVLKADQAKAKKIIDVASKYDNDLLKLQKEHTRKGELDKATAIQGERKTCTESAPVIAANALLVKATNPDLKNKSQSKLKPSPNKPQIHITPSDPSVKTDIDTLREGKLMGNNRTYTFKEIPKILQGLNFIRMECKMPGDYEVVIQGGGIIYVLVVANPTDGSELIKDGWKKTQYTITTTPGDLILVYERFVSDETIKIKSTGNWAYMLATEIPIKLGD